jgi:hypothetical protein
MLGYEIPEGDDNNREWLSYLQNIKCRIALKGAINSIDVDSK